MSIADLVATETPLSERTVGSLVEQVRALNAGRIGIVTRDAAGRPVSAVYVVVEPELIDVFEQVGTAWDEEEGT